MSSMVLDKVIDIYGMNYNVRIEIHPSGCLYDYQVKVFDSFENLIGTRVKSSNTPVNLVELIKWVIQSMKDNDFMVAEAFSKSIRQLDQWDGKIAI
ncbi:hypothetical protein [Enterocloster citroniae]|uniref:hypothetical protein n=1 Tax=Enterocloster citroniae TaxID=358743 RepID=UPI00058C34D6|nr:hypothetical protein [Enterocloster citroniae]MCC3383218.1 hypothetical protein [Enterocloster citroniae]